MATPLTLQRPYSPHTHISVVEKPRPDDFITFTLEEICTNVLYVHFTDGPGRAYVCEFPNCLEVD